MASEEDRTSVEPVVASAEGNRRQDLAIIIGRFLEVRIDPVAVIVITGDFRERVNLLPVKVREARELDFWFMEFDLRLDDAKIVLGEVNWATVEVESLEAGRRATDDLDRSCGVDVANEVENFALLLRCTDEVACLDNHIRGAVIGSGTCGGHPKVVGLVPVQHVDVKVTVDTNDLAIVDVVRNVPGDDSVIIISLLHFNICLWSLQDRELRLLVVLDGDLVVLIWPSINNQNGLVLILLPREDFGGRVDDVLVTNWVVANVNLRVTTVEHEVISKLGNLNIAMVDSLDGETVRSRLQRVVLRMSGDIELGRVSCRRRDGDVAIVGKLQRGVEAVRLEVGGRDVEEVGLELDLAVLLTPDLSLFGDLRAVVVGREAFRMAKVTPVGAAIGLPQVSLLLVCNTLNFPYHVNIEDGRANRVVILVQNTLELHVEQQSAVVETGLAPMLEATTLELDFC